MPDSFQYFLQQQTDSTEEKSVQPDTTNTKKIIHPVNENVVDSPTVKITNKEVPLKDSSTAGKGKDDTTGGKIAAENKIKPNPEDSVKTSITQEELPLFNEVADINNQGDPDSIDCFYLSKPHNFNPKDFVLNSPWKQDEGPNYYAFVDESFKDQGIVQPVIAKEVKDSLKTEVLIHPVVRTDVSGEVKKIAVADWMYGVMLFSLIILAWVRIFFYKYLSGMVKAAYSYQTSYKLLESRSSLSQRVALVVNIMACVNLGLWSYLIMDFFDFQIFNISPILAFFLITCCIMLIYLGRLIVFNILGFIFKAEGAVSEYIHNVFIYIKVLGLIYLPFVIAIPLVPQEITPVLVNISLAIFLIAFALRLLRGVQICVKINLSIFYLILYLCTLEILPGIVFYKFFTTLI